MKRGKKDDLNFRWSVKKMAKIRFITYESIEFTD